MKFKTVFSKWILNQSRVESKNERDVISRDVRSKLKGIQTSVSSTAEEDVVWFRDARRVLREVQTSVSSTAEEDVVWFRDARRVLREVQTSVSSMAEEDVVWYRDARSMLLGGGSVPSTAEDGDVPTALHGLTLKLE